MYHKDAQQQAMSFLVEQASYIEPQVYEIQYPDIQYPRLVPVDTSASEWAKTVTFFSSDKVGQAQWFHHEANDVPRADVTREKFEHQIEMAAIGYGYTLEELGQAMLIPGTNLSIERASAARRAYEEFLDRLVVSGDASKGWNGLSNSSLITPVTAANGAGGSPLWSQKTPDEILKDVNDALTGVFSDSLTVELADTVLLDVTRYNLIATKRLTDTSMTILQFLQANNVYTAQTGQPLMIGILRQLDDAGSGNTSRMVVYRRDPQVLKLHLPMPHRFLPVWQAGPIRFDVPGIFRTGGLEIRRPGAFRYVDGIGSGNT